MSNPVPQQHPAVVLRSQYRQLRALLAVMVVAIVGLSTTVVVLSVDDQPATTATTIHVPTAQLGDPLQGRTQPTRETGKPDESAIASAVSQGESRQVEQSRPLGGPNESAVAAAISAKPSSASSPDESKIAAAIGSHSETGPIARARAYQEAVQSMTPKQVQAAFGLR